MDISQSSSELRKHLDEQLAFLKRSADSYDDGFVDEAKRLAVTIRILVHDTSQSKSLLGQLGEKTKPFLDTAAPLDMGNILLYGALVQTMMSNKGAAYTPILDSPGPPHPTKLVPFDDWWDRTIFRNKEGQTLSRKQLVLTVANKDGGAHIDPNLNEFYANLSRHTGLGWVFESADERYIVRQPELAAVRQIAHELIKSIDPGYTKKLRTPPDAILFASPVLIQVGKP